jgi:hypothetical protein
MTLIETNQHAVQALSDFRQQHTGQGAEQGLKIKDGSSNTLSQKDAGGSSSSRGSSGGTSTSTKDGKSTHLDVPKPVRSKYLHVMERCASLCFLACRGSSCSPASLAVIVKSSC